MGAGLGLLFLLSLAAVLRPRNPKELLILGSAAVSPMSLYALERANNDLVIFLLVISGAMLLTFPRPYRLFSYGLFVAAGLLKYYPLALLVLVAREERRDGLVIAAAVILAPVFFAVAFYPELSLAVASIPAGASYNDQRRRLALRRADRAKHIGRGEAEILWRDRPAAGLPPHPGQAVLLADARLVLKPHLDSCTAWLRRPDSL